MSTVVKRGFAPDDPKEFGAQAVETLHKAAADLQYLLNQGYPIYFIWMRRCLIPAD